MNALYFVINPWATSTSYTTRANKDRYILELSLMIGVCTTVRSPEWSLWGSIIIWACLKMRCPFYWLKRCTVRPHFETSPYFTFGDPQSKLLQYRAFLFTTQSLQEHTLWFYEIGFQQSPSKLQWATPVRVFQDSKFLNAYLNSNCWFSHPQPWEQEPAPAAFLHRRGHRVCSELDWEKPPPNLITCWIWRLPKSSGNHWGHATTRAELIWESNFAIQEVWKASLSPSHIWLPGQDRPPNPTPCIHRWSPF